MDNLRVAVAVTNAVFGNIQDNLDRVRRWTKAAKSKAADLICFPEMNITGYYNHPDIRAIAEPIPGPISERLKEISQSQGLIILAGMAEQSEAGDVYASHLMVDPGGAVENYRKIHIAPPEKAYIRPGIDAGLFSVKGYKFGIQLCYDAHFPELTTKMALNGADIIFLPHASPRGTPIEKFNSWMRHMPARAFDNGLYIVACNQTGDNGRDLSFPGVSLAIDPSGNVMEKDISGNEGFLVVEMKRQVLDHVRDHEMRYFLPNRRPEVYNIK